MAGNFEVWLSPAAERDLERVNDPDASRIEKALERLEADARPKGAVKLQNDVFRLRVGDYRIIYFVDDKEKAVVVTHIRRRTGSTYRRI